jgi:cholesterol transport system auxiliary component
MHMKNATFFIANYSIFMRAGAVFFASMLVLAGCATPDKPVRPAIYDFGPGAMAVQPSNSMTPLPALALADIDTPPALDSTALLYRLNYADAQQLRPYALARWSMTPSQLLRQRLREKLGQRRAMLNPGDSVANGAAPSSLPILRIDLEEFSQVFDSASSSVGLLRLRATVVQATAQGDRLIGQRSVIVQRPAPTADAAGGVRALTLATDAALDELDAWVQQLR